VNNAQNIPPRFRPALERLDGEVSLLCEMAAITAEDLPEVKEATETALEEGDCEQAASGLHKLKGMLSTFDADGVVLDIQEVLDAAHSLAYTEIIRHGEIWENDTIYRAIELAPELFQVVYLDVLSKKKSAKLLETALAEIDAYLLKHYEDHLQPLLHFLKKQNRTVPLSEISDHFAYSQVYPWHLESACEWLERKGFLEKLSAPFKLTKRSQEQVEEPAYYLDPSAP